MLTSWGGSSRHWFAIDLEHFSYVIQEEKKKKNNPPPKQPTNQTTKQTHHHREHRWSFWGFCLRKQGCLSNLDCCSSWLFCVRLGEVLHGSDLLGQIFMLWILICQYFFLSIEDSKNTGSVGFYIMYNLKNKKLYSIYIWCIKVHSIVMYN